MSSFALNFQDLWEIDITPNEATATWARLGAGISGADPSNNENVAQDTYLDGDGYGSSQVIGAQRTIAFTGHRVVGNLAQDWIAAIASELGDARTTSLRVTEADGSQWGAIHRSGGQGVTVANIDIGGGDPGAKKDIGFEIHVNGKPTATAKSAAASLTATVAGGTVVGTTKFTATPGVGNTLAYKLTAASIGTVYGGSYPSNLIAYTSAANIVATLGQVLNMYELDANGRVAKFASETLAGSDITT